MSESQDPGISHEQAAKNSRRIEQGKIAGVAADLMNAYNRQWKDPGVMACNGHDSMFGYEFRIPRDGVTYVVEVRQDYMGD
jgi:hypothetical protein